MRFKSQMLSLIQLYRPFAGVDQSKVDKSTEEWLDTIEDRLDYKRWYCGHYHTDKKVDRLTIMFESVEEYKL